MSADTNDPQSIAAQMNATAAALWGTERAHELAGAIATSAEALARIASAKLEVGEADPDFLPPTGRGDQHG